MGKEEYIDNIKQIKEMMERSSKFISLSSYSGIVIGIFAMIGSYFTFRDIYGSLGGAIPGKDSVPGLLIIGSSVLVLSIVSIIILTSIRAKKLNLGLWDAQSKRVLTNLAIPLVSGGLLCLILLLQGYIELVVPLTLVFYGFALVNASKYTLSEIRSLGIIEIVLGLAGTYFINYGLLFWTFGFGVMHIIYGFMMGLKYER